MLGLLGANSVFGGNLFGTKQGTVDSHSSTTPWEPVQPFLKDVFSQAQGLYNRGTQPFGAQAMGVLNDTVGGQYLNPASNPFLAGSVKDALGLAGSAFAGQYGGAAGSHLGNSGYQEGLARTLGNVATNAYADNYGRERQNQMAALALQPALQQQQQAAPWLNLARYKDALTVPFSQGTNQTPYYQNNTAQTLGALAGLGGLLMG